MPRIVPKRIKEIEAEAAMLRTVMRTGDLTPAEQDRLHVKQYILRARLDDANGVRRVRTSGDIDAQEGR